MAIQTIRTKDTEAKVLEALKAGHSRDVAAAEGHINPRTFDEWMLDEEFAQAVFEAEAVPEKFHLANINRAAAAGMWTASMTWLERRRPRLYSRVDRTVALMLVEVSDLREELKREGIEISEADLLKEYKTLNAGQAALPSGRRSR